MADVICPNCNGISRFPQNFGPGVMVRYSACQVGFAYPGLGLAVGRAPSPQRPAAPTAAPTRLPSTPQPVASTIVQVAVPVTVVVNQPRSVIHVVSGPALLPKWTWRQWFLGATGVLASLYVLGLIVTLADGDPSRFPRAGQAIMGLILGSPAGAGLLILYLAPSIIATNREHPNAMPITIINVIFGCSLVGYVLALAWSLSAFEKM